MRRVRANRIQNGIAPRALHNFRVDMFGVERFICDKPVEAIGQPIRLAGLERCQRALKRSITRSSGTKIATMAKCPKISSFVTPGVTP